LQRAEPHHFCHHKDRGCQYRALLQAPPPPTTAPDKPDYCLVYGTSQIRPRRSASCMHTAAFFTGATDGESRSCYMYSLPSHVCTTVICIPRYTNNNAIRSSPSKCYHYTFASRTSVRTTWPSMPERKTMALAVQTLVLRWRPGTAPPSSIYPNIRQTIRRSLTRLARGLCSNSNLKDARLPFDALASPVFTIYGLINVSIMGPPSKMELGRDRIFARVSLSDKKRRTCSETLCRVRHLSVKARPLCFSSHVCCP
jgi:hypothetical protein